MFLQCFDTVGWVIWSVKTRPQYDLQCVWWDVKPYSINQPYDGIEVCILLVLGLLTVRKFIFNGIIYDDYSLILITNQPRKLCHWSVDSSWNKTQLVFIIDFHVDGVWRKAIISQLPNLCTEMSISCQLANFIDSWCPLRCSFGCVLLLHQIFFENSVPFDSTTPIYLINLLLKLDSQLHFFYHQSRRACCRLAAVYPASAVRHAVTQTVTQLLRQCFRIECHIVILNKHAYVMVLADSHEDHADISVPLTHRSRHAALHLNIASVRWILPVTRSTVIARRFRQHVQLLWWMYDVMLAFVVNMLTVWWFVCADISGVGICVFASALNVECFYCRQFHMSVARIDLRFYVEYLLQFSYVTVVCWLRFFCFILKYKNMHSHEKRTCRLWKPMRLIYMYFTRELILPDVLASLYCISLCLSFCYLLSIRRINLYIMHGWSQQSCLSSRKVLVFNYVDHFQIFKTCKVVDKDISPRKSWNLQKIVLWQK